MEGKNMPQKKCRVSNCFSSATCRDGKCAQHTNAMRAVLEYSSHSLPRRYDVSYLGTELECITPNTLARRAVLAQTIQPHHDGSLGANGAEFKLLAPAHTATGIVERKTAPVVTSRFAGRLQALGACVNHDCGFHVHLDAR